MPKERCKFTRSQIERASKAALACGLTIQRVEIDQGGRVSIITTKEDDARETEEVNSCDRVLG